MALLAQLPTPPARSRAGLRAGAAVVLGSAALSALLLGHAQVPDVAGMGLLLDSGLIWLGATIPALGLLALAARRKRVAVVVLVPALIWAVMFVPGMVPLAWSAPPAAGNPMTVVSQNLQAGSGTAAESARTLADSGAQVVALQEIAGAARDSVAAELGARYGYSYLVGTVGLWSSYPIRNARPEGLGLGWNRALSADLATPGGTVRIYVVHAASARPADHTERDIMLTSLARTIAADSSERLVAVGDFNAAATDRHFTPLLEHLSEPRQDTGLPGFTWPASPFPVTRLDHVLQRGMSATSNTVLRAGAGDHLALRTSFTL